jgi:CheY-like chemotaxis protein
MSHRNEVTVLLVEDDDVDAEAVSRSFGKNEVAAELQRAESGTRALEILRADKPDDDDESSRIIFLDLNMPGVNGHEFLVELRTDPRLSKTPVFILTTSDHARDIEKAYSQNVAGYFTKSHLSDLITVLNHYITGARLPSVR